jgi:hypothetical protein
MMVLTMMKTHFHTIASVPLNSLHAVELFKTTPERLRQKLNELCSNLRLCTWRALRMASLNAMAHILFQL